MNGILGLAYVMLMTEGACNNINSIGGVDGIRAKCRKAVPVYVFWMNFLFL